MHIADTFLHDGKVHAACSGSGITEGMSIRKIKAGSGEYDVISVYVVNSFIGIPQAVLELKGQAMPPLGEITIVE